MSAELRVPIGCVDSQVLGRLHRRDLGFPGYEVLGQVWWRQLYAIEVMGSPVGEHRGQERARGGWCREVGMSAVLEAASDGCRNSNKVVVCQPVPVSGLRVEEDGVRLCGR